MNKEQRAALVDEMLEVYNSGEESGYSRSSFICEVFGYGSDRWSSRMTILSSEGGGEGGAEDCTTIFKWGDKIYSVDFSYYSHHGYEMDYAEDTIREVKPVEKTVTVYERV